MIYFSDQASPLLKGLCEIFGAAVEFLLDEVFESCRLKSSSSVAEIFKYTKRVSKPSKSIQATILLAALSSVASNISALCRGASGCSSGVSGAAGKTQNATCFPGSIPGARSGTSCPLTCRSVSD